MSLKIVFMGTPDFAVTTLSALLQSPHEVVGVVTNIDKPAGRGKRMHESAVKNMHVSSSYPYSNPQDLKIMNF